LNRAAESLWPVKFIELGSEHRVTVDLNRRYGVNQRDA